MSSACSRALATLRTTERVGPLRTRTPHVRMAYARRQATPPLAPPPAMCARRRGADALRARVLHSRLLHAFVAWLRVSMRRAAQVG